MNKAQVVLNNELKFQVPKDSVLGQKIKLYFGEVVTHTSSGKTGVVVKILNNDNYRIKWDGLKYPRKPPDGYPPDEVNGSVLKVG